MNLGLYKNHIETIEISPLTLTSTSDVFWHASVIGKVSQTCGGLSRDKKQAIRIGIAEFIERFEFARLAKSIDRSSYMLDEFPTSCGFAAGFDSLKTKKRSIAESIERWCWSKWIDEGYSILEVFPTNLSDITRSLLKKFDAVRYFKVNIDDSTIKNFEFPCSFYVILGFKNNGVFPGSRVDSDDFLGWEHCATEAWRHLLIFNKDCNDGINSAFPFNRIYFFGKNGMPKNLIVNQNCENWPIPKIKICKQVPTICKDAFVWRSVIDDYIGWDKGDYARFVY